MIGYIDIGIQNTSRNVIRVNMFPDGGIARLRVNGQVVRDFSKFPRDAAIDLLAVENG